MDARLHLNLSECNQSQISKVFCTLLRYNVKILKVKTKLDGPDEEKELLDKLKHLKLSYNTQDPQKEGQLLDLLASNDSVSSSARFSVVYKNTLNKSLFRQEISHLDLVYCVKHIIGERKLIQLAKKYQISIKVEEKKISFLGPEDVIQAVIDYIKNIAYERCSVMNNNKLICLRQTNFMRVLSNQYDTKIHIIFNNETGVSQFFICGEDRGNVRDCRIKVEAAAKNIILFKVLKRVYDVANIQQIFHYLKEKFERQLKRLFKEKKVSYQVGLVETLDQEKLFYIFVENPGNYFEKIKEWTENKIRTLCIIRHKDDSEYLSYADLNLSKASISRNKDNFITVIGKEKYITEKIGDLFEDENSANISKVLLSSLFENIEKNNSNITKVIPPIKNQATSFEKLVEKEWEPLLPELYQLEKEIVETKETQKDLEDFIINQAKEIDLDQPVSSLLKKIQNSEAWGSLKEEYKSVCSKIQKNFKQQVEDFEENILRFPQKADFQAVVPNIQQKKERETVKKKKSPGRERAINNQKHIWMDVFCWNARSLKKPEKFSFLTSNKAHIQLVQEIWNPDDKMLGQLKNHRPLKRIAKSGGGTLVNLSTSKLKFVEEFPVNEDMVLHKILLAPNLVIWLASVYLNKGEVDQVIQLFRVIKKVIPEEQRGLIVMAGDWNINLNEISQQKRVLNDYCNELGLRICYSKTPTRVTSMLDFAVVGYAIEVSKIQVIESVSDHRALKFKIGLLNLLLS